MQFSAETKATLVDLIKSVVREELAAQQKYNNSVTEVYTDMKIVKANNPTKIIVEDMATGRRIENVPNKSGDDVSVGDIVRVYETSGGGFGNVYIGINWGKP